MSQLDVESESRLEKIREDVLDKIGSDIRKLKRAYRDQSEYQSLEFLEEVKAVCEHRTQGYFEKFLDEAKLLINNTPMLTDGELAAFEQKFLGDFAEVREDIKDMLFCAALLSDQEDQALRVKAEIASSILEIKDAYFDRVDEIKSLRKFFNLSALVSRRQPLPSHNIFS